MATQFKFVTDDHRMIGETVDRLFVDLAVADAAQRLKNERRLDRTVIAGALNDLGIGTGAEPDAMMASAQVQAQIAFAAGTACLAYPVLETLIVQALAVDTGHVCEAASVSTMLNEIDAQPTKLTGVVSRVAFIENEPRLLVPLRQGSKAGFVVIERDAPGVALRERGSVEPDYTLHDASLDVVRSDDAELIGDAIALDAVRRRADLLAAAEIAGACRTMVRMTREHILTRVQFGNAIGTNQALKHRLADAHIQAEALAWTVQYASAAADGKDAEAGALIAGAKLYAGTIGKLVAEAAMQLHGAIGYTFEFPLHLYMRRVLRLGSSFADRSALEATLLDEFTRGGLPRLTATSGEGI